VDKRLDISSFAPMGMHTWGPVGKEAWGHPAQVGSNMDAEARKRTKQQIPPVQCHEQPCHEQPHAAISIPPPNACKLARCIDPPPPVHVRNVPAPRSIMQGDATHAHGPR